jgi:hypothetical protein
VKHFDCRRFWQIVVTVPPSQVKLLHTGFSLRLKLGLRYKKTMGARLQQCEDIAAESGSRGAWCAAMTWPWEVPALSIPPRPTLGKP